MMIKWRIGLGIFWVPGIVHEPKGDTFGFEEPGIDVITSRGSRQIVRRSSLPTQAYKSLRTTFHQSVIHRPRQLSIDGQQLADLRDKPKIDFAERVRLTSDVQLLQHVFVGGIVASLGVVGLNR